jgi:uncharacterized protein (TIRG00374 family)
MKNKRIIKNIFALLLISVLLYVVDPASLWGALKNISLDLIFYLGLLSVLLIYVSALKWKMFLEAFGASISVFRLCSLYLVGYFVNMIAPSYVGGDLVRSWYLGKKVGQHEALTSTILERYTGLVAMVLLALVFMWQVDLVTFEIQLAVLFVAAGLTAVSLLALSESLLDRLGAIKRLEPFLKHVRKIQKGFHLVRKDYGLLLRALFLSFVFHSFTVVNVIAASYAVGWTTIPIQELFVVLPLILLIGAIPIAPSGLGIQEGAFYFFLHGLGASPAEALGVGVVLRAKAYVLALVGGVIWLRVRKGIGGVQKADEQSDVAPSAKPVNAVQ